MIARIAQLQQQLARDHAVNEQLAALVVQQEQTLSAAYQAPAAPQTAPARLQQPFDAQAQATYGLCRCRNVTRVPRPRPSTLPAGRLDTHFTLGALTSRNILGNFHYSSKLFRVSLPYKVDLLYSSRVQIPSYQDTYLAT